MSDKPIDRYGNLLSASDLISGAAGNTLTQGADGKLYNAATAVVNDDQVLSGDNTTNVSVTLTPAVVTDTAGGSQTNYTISASAKIDGTTIQEDPTTHKLYALGFKHSKEWHVDPNGSDITGTGAEDKPYLTVAKALTMPGSSGDKVVIHPGTYVEDVTVTQLNLDIVGSHGTVSGISYINGTITVASNGSGSSVRLGSLMTNNVVHTGTARLVFDKANVKTSFSKTGTGSVTSHNSFIVGASITGAGQCNFYQGEVTGVTVNNASAVAVFANVSSLYAPVVTAGMFAAADCTIFASTAAGNAITAAAGTLVVLRNCYCYDTPAVAGTLPSVTKVALNGMYSLADVFVNKAASTLVTNINYVQWFDDIGLVNVPTITTATKALVRSADGTVSEQLFPTGGGAWVTTTSDPAATGNTGTLPRFVHNTQNGSKWYIDSSGVGIKIEDATVALTPVYINAVSPSTATIFDTANPPVTNNNALKNRTDALYIGTDSSLWVSNGTAYSTYSGSASTEWYFAGTTSDAGGNKTLAISRTGSATIDNGYLRAVNSSTLNAFTIDPTDAVGPKLKLGTTSSPEQYLVIGAYNSQNNLNTTNRNFQMFSTANANAFSLQASTGWLGANLAPANVLSVFDVNGSFGVNIVKTSAASYTQTNTDATVVMQTSGSVFTLASSVQRRKIDVKNGSTGNISITGHIDNVASTTLTIPASQSRTLHGDGTTWWII